MFRSGFALGLVVATSVVVGAASCSDDGGGNSSCVLALEPDCTPLYEPTFDAIFTRTIEPTCAVAGGACHSPSAGRGGISFGSADEAYSELVGEGRVAPGDPGCSLVVRRIAGQRGFMPPGMPLSSAERCAIETWITNGALR